MVITEGGRFLGVSLGFICLSVCVYMYQRERKIFWLSYGSWGWCAWATSVVNLCWNFWLQKRAESSRKELGHLVNLSAIVSKFLFWQFFPSPHKRQEFHIATWPDKSKGLTMATVQEFQCEKRPGAGHNLPVCEVLNWIQLPEVLLSIQQNKKRTDLITLGRKFCEVGVSEDMEGQVPYCVSKSRKGV